MKFHLSLVGAALALCLAAPLSAQTLAAWTDPVNVSSSDGSLTKNGGCDGCPDAGALSQTQLASGDGYVEFVPDFNSRLFAGLGTDLTSSTASSDINYAWSIWPGGTWEIRENGVYKADGTFATGDRFRVAVENGVVVYRQNGTLVYTSAVAPTYPMALDVSLYSTGASLSQAALSTPVTTTSTSTTSTTTSTVSATSPTTASSTSTAGPALTAIGPYVAVTDRNAYTKPALPALGAAGSTITDPTFQSTILRVTDGNTRPGYLNRSFRTPSSPHQNAWSANGSYFYVVSDDGTPIPFAFDATKGTASRIAPTTTGDGGLTLQFYIEPQFSYVTDSIIYGSVGGAQTIDQYDFSTGAYTRILDLATVVSGLSGTYIGGIGSSAGPTEMMMAFFGGTSQDHHHYAAVFPRSNPSNLQLVDTLASTVNGQPTPIVLNFSLHHVAIDRSGRYVMLYTTSADQAAPRNAAQSYLWDTQTGTFTAYTGSYHPYGHDAFGYGVSVNQDCCTTTTWDAAQWQFRNLSAPATTRDVIATVLSPEEVYLADHTTWNNARSDALTPYISGLYRYGSNTTAWRAWDDEIVAIETDNAAGTDPTVWRFAHHRSDVSNDLYPTQVSFWYEPRPNVSHDGKWVLFTSNWEKTLGTDPVGDSGTGARQDAFVLALNQNTSTATTTTTTTSTTPVSITTSSLPSGVAGTAYAATLQASGGSGTYTWSVATGALPAGVSLNVTTGALSGTPQAAGSFPVTIAAADASNATNTATAAYTIVIAAAPVSIATTSLPGGRVGVAYNATLQASGGSGSYVWSVTAGALPGGVSLNATTGALSGTPQAAGSFAVTMAAADASDATNTASANYTIGIANAPVAVTTASLPAGRATVAYTTTTVQATGGSGSYTWSVTAGALPAGLTLSASGTLSGTPTTAGTYTVTISATDSADASNVGSASYSISVGAAVTITSPRTLPNAKRYTFYSYTVQAANVVGTPVWSLAGGSMPPGITLNAATGIISGTCNNRGTWSFNVHVTDSSTSDTLTLTLTVTK